MNQNNTEDQSAKVYFSCSKCGVNGWYSVEQSNCSVLVEAVECSCGEWV